MTMTQPTTSTPSTAPSSAPEDAPASGGAVGRSRRLGALLVVLLVAVVAAAYVYLPVLGVALPVPGDLADLNGLPTTTLVAVPALLALLFMLLLVRRGFRAHRRTRRAAENEAPVDNGNDGEDLVPSMDPRALLLYARSLEGTLSDQEDRLQHLRRAADERRQADLEQEHRRARATVELMRRVHAHQPGVVALGRTEAAVARLGVEPGFRRPLLPSGPAGTMPVVFVPAPEPAAADAATGSSAQPTPPLSEGEIDEPVRPVPSRGSLAEREAAMTEPAAPVTVELTAAGRPKVRPVPPPPESTPARRGRLRRRGPRS